MYFTLYHSTVDAPKKRASCTLGETIHTLFHKGQKVPIFAPRQIWGQRLGKVVSGHAINVIN